MTFKEAMSFENSEIRREGTPQYDWISVSTMKQNNGIHLEDALADDWVVRTPYEESEIPPQTKVPEETVREKKIAFGIVILKEWMNNPTTGQEVRCIAGPLELVQAKDFGFQPKGNETNWGVRVGDDIRGVLILGCQIRGVYWGEQLETPGLAVWRL